MGKVLYKYCTSTFAISILYRYVYVRKKIECEIGEEHQGFRKGRGTTDGLSTLRQFVDKKLEKQGSMCIGFVDLEKAFDTM